MIKLEDAIVQTTEFKKLAKTIDGVKTQNTPGNIVNYKKNDRTIEVAVRISKTVMKTLDNSAVILKAAKEVLGDQCGGVRPDYLKCHLAHLSRTSGTVLLKINKPLEEMR